MTQVVFSYSSPANIALFFIFFLYKSKKIHNFGIFYPISAVFLIFSLFLIFFTPNESFALFRKFLSYNLVSLESEK